MQVLASHISLLLPNEYHAVTALACVVLTLQLT
jgi:hypothetical protein